MTLEETIRVQIPDYAVKSVIDFDKVIDMWESRKYQSNVSFLRAKERLSNIKTRAQIIQVFADNQLYDGYVSTIVWGNIGLYQNGARVICNAFGNSENEVFEKLDRVREKIIAGRISEAFSSMCRGNENRLNGLGVSFFTKLMYFIGAAYECPVEPLIFDSHSLAMLKALYKDAGMQRMARQSVSCYMDYVDLMKILSEKLELTDAGHLEALLFNSGKSLIKEYAHE